MARSTAQARSATRETNDYSQILDDQAFLMQQVVSGDGMETGTQVSVNDQRYGENRGRNYDMPKPYQPGAAPTTHMSAAPKSSQDFQ